MTTQTIEQTETEASRTAALVATSDWLGGKTVAEARDFIKANKLKLRAGSIGILDTAKMKYEHRPIIECWAKEKRRYLPFEFAETPWFKSREERDAVLAAVFA